MEGITKLLKSYDKGSIIHYTLTHYCKMFKDVIEVMEKFANSLSDMDLPSAPKKLITIHKDPFRPQPRLDRELEGGMTTSVGRIRKDEVFPNGIKYVLLSHNTRMGAAKGVILTSEMLINSNIIKN